MSRRDPTDRRMVNRRTFLKVFGGTIAVATVAGCAQTAAPAPSAATPAGGTTAPAQPKGLTLRSIIHLYPPTQAIMGLLPEYEKETGVKVELDQIPFGEGYAKQMAELTTGMGRYDMLTPWSYWSNGEIGTGKLEVLDDYIAKAGSALDFDDFLAVQRDLFNVGGKQYGIPISSQTHFNVFRKDVYEAAGVSVPTDGTLMIDQFEAAVKKMHKAPELYGAVWGFQPLGASFMDWSGLFHAGDGQYFDEKLNPTFNSPVGLAAAEWMKSMLQYMPPDVLTFGNTERDETYQRGLAAVQITSPLSRVPAVLDPEKSKVADKSVFTSVPFKGFNGVTKFDVAPSFDEGWAFVINTASKNKQEAFNFILWVSQKERQRRMALDSAIAPARTSLFADPEIQAKHVWLGGADRQFKANAAAKKVYPKLPEFGEITEIMGGELQAGLSGQYPLKQALDRANDAIANLMKERGYKVGTHTGKMPWE